MIIFELGCPAGHRFEGWFARAEDFEAQRQRRLLACPVCASGEVEKIPHAKIATAEAPKPSPAPALPATAVPAPTERFQAIAALVRQVLTVTEDVGRDFPDEARRIHHEEAPNRAIRGVASADEAQALLDEGITVLPLPMPPREDWS
jgi:hypothetical protein